MSLKGNIDSFSLPSILQLLSADKKTGILTITDKGRKVQIYIKKGNIVHAMGSQKEVRLGYLLRTKGIISAEELQNSLALAKQRKERLGKILVEKGYISHETLKKFIHQQVREILYDLFLWKRGDFDYKDQQFQLDEDLATEFNHMEIILEGTRRVDEWAILRKNISHPQMVFKISRSVVQQKDSVNLTANEWRILSLVDGKRTVQQIIADSGHDEFTVYRIINSLISSGIIEKSERESAVQPARQVEAPSIIQLYHEVLQNLRKLLERAMGPEAATLLQESKNGMPAEQQRLLRSFDCRRDLKSNIRLVLEAAGEAQVTKEALFDAFNSWILAILHRERTVLDPPAMRANLQGLIQLVRQWQKRPDQSELKRAILTTITQTIEQFRQEVGSQPAARDKGGGVLSFLRRK